MVPLWRNYLTRFFAFGCSFTDWICPTWADMLADHLQLEYQNWGMAGMGNVAIMHQMVACDLKFKFTSDDIIIVGWSLWNREDRYNNGWLCGGNILHNHNFDQEFIKKHWHPDNDIIKNGTAIISCNKMFNITAQFHAMPYKDSIDEYNNDMLYKQIDQNFKDTYMNLPGEIFPLDRNTKFNLKCRDAHPDVMCHFKYLKYNLAPQLNLTIDKEIEQKYQKLHNDIATNINRKMEYIDLKKIIFPMWLKQPRPKHIKDL